MLKLIYRYLCAFGGKIRADIFVSGGGACRPAHYLRKFHLRTFSSPFDWMMAYKLNDIVHLLQNDGRGFFAQIKEIPQDKKYECRFIKDCQTGMISMHDFPRDKSIDEHYPEFIDKHKRRFEKLKNEIKNAKNIVFIANRGEPMSEFKAFLEKMQNFHKASYTLIIIRHNKQATKLKKTVRMTMGGGGIIIKYIFNDTHKNGSDGVSNPDAWLGNVEIWDEIMKELKFTHKKAFVIFLERKREKIKRFYKKYIIKNAKY